MTRQDISCLVGVKLYIPLGNWTFRKESVTFTQLTQTHRNGGMGDMCGYKVARPHRGGKMDIHDEQRELLEFANTVAEWHFVVATHPNQTISTCESLGGKIYDHSQKLLIAAIRAAFPNLDETDIASIYDVWVDCNESIAYCAKWVMENK